MNVDRAKHIEESEESEESEDLQELANPGRRKLLIALSRAVLAAPLITLLSPNEAQANSSIITSPDKYRGYPNMINQLRNKFGRRMDYQMGFTQATSQTGSIQELPADIYGILAEKAPSNAIKPMSSFPVEETGYLHVEQSTKYPELQALGLSSRLSKAKADLQKTIETSILTQYFEYGQERNILGNTWLLDRVRKPVVTLDNFRNEKVEMFLRIPKPGTREYYLMTTKRWRDYYNQGKLRHKHAFNTMYDSNKSFYENLTTMYGPQFQAMRNAKQAAKNTFAIMIGKVNSTLGKHRLTQNQKNSLNNSLGVTGTRYEIK